MLCTCSPAVRVLVEESLTLWGYSVIRLDQKFCDAEICCDFMDWDFRAEYPPGHFHLIAAGPPCTEYSIAKTIGLRNLEWSDQLVCRTKKSLSTLTPRVVDRKPTHWAVQKAWTVGLLFVH